MQRRMQLSSVNPNLTCILCHGYLVDATTIVECLHSFCRSCIVKHLETSFNCPECNTEIHKTKPLEYIRSDPSLQEIVYKLVPDLYSKEATRKDEWKKSNVAITEITEPGPSASQTETDDVRIMVTLKYFRGTSRMERIKTEHVLQMFPTRYLCCQPEMPVRVLKKFVQYKFDISPEIFQLEMWRGDETLLDDLTLKELVQIYGLFRERKPLELHYSFYPKFQCEEVELEPSIPIATTTTVATMTVTTTTVTTTTATPAETTPILSHDIVPSISPLPRDDDELLLVVTENKGQPNTVNISVVTDEKENNDMQIANDVSTPNVNPVQDDEEKMSRDCDDSNADRSLCSVKHDYVNKPHGEQETLADTDVVTIPSKSEHEDEVPMDET